MKKTTIKELGSNLPIGILDKGKLKKEFVLRPYKSKVDRILNIWREVNEGKPLGYLTAKYISLVVDRVADIGFTLDATGNSGADQELKIHNWYFADVLYALIYSRITSISNIIEVAWSCPMRNAEGAAKCNGQGIAKADLWSTEVNVIEDVKELEHWLKLKKGFKLRDGGLCRKVKMKPVTFQSQLSIGAASVGINSVGYHHFMDAIIGVDCLEGDYILTMGEIDEIEKIDALTIDRQAGKIAAGADLRTHLECSKCGAKIVNALNWSFDHFFDYSIPSEVLMI